jgi:hypothetical protein
VTSQNEPELQAKYDKLSADYQRVVDAVTKACPGPWPMHLSVSMQNLFNSMKKAAGLL